MESTVFQATPNDHGRRLDRILRKLFKNESLSFIYKSLREKKILVNSKPAVPDYRCQSGDIIEVFLPLNASLPAPSHQAEVQQKEAAEMLKSMILLDTADLLILNKPRGMLAHNGKDSLDALVQAFYQSSHPEKSLAFTPGPLHRLDRNTSGIITFSRSIEGARQFSAGMREGKLKKTYLAILDGSLSEPESWTDPLVRNENQKTTLRAEPLSNNLLKSARTDVRPLACHEGFTFTAIRLFSGRTHQIRAHSSIHGYPLSGDRKYGSRTDLQYYFLHAWMLDLSLLELPMLPEQIQAPVPPEFLFFLSKRLCLSEKEVYSLLQDYTKNF